MCLVSKVQRTGELRACVTAKREGGSVEIEMNRIDVR